MADGLTVGYAAALEQFHPTEIVRLAELAEGHGFSGVMAADHFQPWVPAAGAERVRLERARGARRAHHRATSGPGVTAPTFRWHPAMVAQASATLAAMYPGRHWLGLGSGEALNEHIVAGYWPEARRADQPHVRGDRDHHASSSTPRSPARTSSTRGSSTSWSRPGCGRCRRSPPEILVATAGPVTAKRAGRHADGLITVGAPLEKIAGAVRAVRRGRPRGRQGPATPCRRCCRSTCPGPRRTRRRWRTR